MNRVEVMQSQYLAGRVRRYHTWPVLTQETVAEHSFGVALIYVALFGIPRGEVFVHILQHDLSELHTGDAPYPVKQKYPRLKEALARPELDAVIALGLVQSLDITDREKIRIKVCDLLQMHVFGQHEMLLGNTYARPIRDDTAHQALVVCDHEDHGAVLGWLAKGGWRD